MGFATRNLLTKIYTFSQRTAQETTAIETVTGDKLIAAGINITFDDFSRDANRITSMVDADSRYWQRYFFKYTWYMDVDSDQDLTDNLAALQAILAKEHELANHSVNHPVWTTYVIENGAAALVNNEILPAQTSFDNVLGITPDGYAYHGDMGYNATVNSLLLSNGFDYIRYAVKSPENVINDACYDIVTGGALFPAWYNNETSINDIRGAIDYARDNNKVFVIVFHQLGAVESGTTASYEKIEQILEYILENNMSMYNSSELPNL
jgi:peptidoglycan/xylan/chitin deacetylase (PgdA/CDA1 family)